MKKFYFIALMCFLCSSVMNAQVTTSPSPPEADQPVTIFFNKTGTGLASYSGTIYAHIGLTVDNQPWQYVIGNWGDETGPGAQPALTFVSGTTHSLTLSPDLYTYFGVPTTSSITQICVVFRNEAGNQQTSDIFINVGAFQANLTSPALNSTTVMNAGGSLNIAANNSNGSASYNLLANGVSIHTATTSSYSFTDSNITTNKEYDLQITQGQTTYSRKFAVVVNPGVTSEVIPAGKLEGINYDSTDPTKAVLVLEAPEKDFVYVAGSFNNWQPTAAYAMKKDATPNSTRFWIELQGLTPGEMYTYQYWVGDSTPFNNSPALVKTADPFSTLVLSPFDDPWIPASSMAGLPAYPAGQQREVTILQTGKAPYNWQVTNFEKPEKDNLVVYEVLVRDFDADRNYQDMIDRIDYFVNLKVNAIQLMPVMEFEGNESWGYNTAFHMATDKFYGSPEKLKELIDLCHQNGIAVILDIALNHAFGRNPLVRMWMNDPDGDGWGDPSSQNPYFNTQAMHSYSVGSDFNHSSQLTKNYVKRIVQHWINEFKIDGFRWDLTKGFTQQCPPNVAGGQEACTNGYRSDRVEILKQYADFSWEADNTHIVIFEHLGADNEEQQWANYKLNEGKGILMWGHMNSQYNQLSMGYNSNANISRMGHLAHGFTGKRVIGYAESHDEERLMYKNLANGNSSNAAHNVKTLSVALSRMSAIGAMSLLVPGPKMIWHFGELGWNHSIFTCNNGSVNTSSDSTPGDCKLDTKPQPQWTDNWTDVAARSQIYNDWARFIQWKKTEPVFNRNYDLNTSATSLTPRLYLFDVSNSIPDTMLKNVIVISNFNVTAQNIAADFPYTGQWYDLMDGSPINVVNTGMTFNVAAGQFRIFGNQMPTLGVENAELIGNVSIAPNPSTGFFTVNANLRNVEVYSITGQLVKSFNGQPGGNGYDIRDLKTGIYIVKVKDDHNRQATLKLSKQ
jgi:1,4-alpha-glucan branching enzyme